MLERARRFARLTGLAGRPFALGAIALILASCAPPQAATSDRAQSNAGIVRAAGSDTTGTHPRMRLITRQQYLNTLADLFGPDFPVEARFPPMIRKDGLLANSAASAGVTAAQLELYQRTAVRISTAIVDKRRRDYVVPCQPKDEKAADAVCATKFLSSFGRRLYRKPLASEQLKDVVDQANAAADKLQDFYKGLSIATEGMLQAPEFLYITDSFEPDPKNKGQQRLTAHALAQRLSFFLWNTAPDEALLKVADTGEIQTPKGLARIVDVMIASPRLETGMRAFFDDMMAFDRFNTLAKDGEVYPTFTAGDVADAREQTLRTIVHHLLTEKRDYRALYTTRETFISPHLAILYGAKAQDGWTRYEFPESAGRAGIVTHISFLAAHSHPGRSSPTLRGKALRELLLCQPVPSPPANVDFSAFENPKLSHRTQRERVADHLANPVCAGCHRITDPIGLSLELFDGAGIYRTMERGTPIDASGSLDGKTFTDAAGLGIALHDHPALTSCLVRRVYSYGTGGAAANADAPTLTYLHGQFAKQGYRLPDLLKLIVLSPAFSKMAPPSSAEPAEGIPGKA